jgi:hypothetical protein
MMHAIFTNPKFFENQKQPMPMPPEQIFAVMKWFYLAGDAVVLQHAVATEIHIEKKLTDLKS